MYLVTYKDDVAEWLSRKKVDRDVISKCLNLESCNGFIYDYFLRNGKTMIVKSLWIGQINLNMNNIGPLSIRNQDLILVAAPTKLVRNNKL